MRSHVITKCQATFDMVELTVLCPGMILEMEANFRLLSFPREYQISVVSSCEWKSHFKQWFNHRSHKKRKERIKKIFSDSKTKYEIVPLMICITVKNIQLLKCQVNDSASFWFTLHIQFRFLQRKYLISNDSPYSTNKKLINSNF